MTRSAENSATSGAASGPLRVVVVGSGWRFVSGISYYTWHLTTALHEQGHQVGAILMRQLLPARLYPGRDRVGAPVSSQQYDPAIPVFDGVDWWVVPSLVRAVRFLRRQRPEMVVIEWWTATVLHSYLILVFFARASGARVMVEFHEVLDTAELRVPMVPVYSRWLARMIFKRTDGVIIHSEYDRELLAATYRLPDVPVVVVPHGPFDYLRDVDSAAPSTAEGRLDGPLEVLFFGTIRPYKGLEHLVCAFDALTPDEVVDYRLTVVGETWEGWTLPGELIEASPHRDRIHFVNRYVEDGEAAEFLDHADAIVLPYLRSSASGPLHLAMSHGLPLAVTDVGGLREAAEHYKGALLVPPADVEALTVALRGLREMKGQRFDDPHSWKRTVAGVEELACRVVPGRNRVD